MLTLPTINTNTNKGNQARNNTSNSNNIYRLKEGASPDEILNALFCGNWRVMFIGKAGAGKTHVLKSANKWEYHMELLGPSNLAAMLLGGQTLCSWLGIQKTCHTSIEGVNKNRERVKSKLIGLAMDNRGKKCVVYIDEMSYFNTHLFNTLDSIFEEVNEFLMDEGYDPIYLAWGGDFLQLRTIEGIPIYQSHLMPLYNVVITPSVYRQKDKAWKDCLSDVRLGNVIGVKSYFSQGHVQRTQLTTTLLKPRAMGPKGIHIVGTRKDVRTYGANTCFNLSRESGKPWFTYWNGYKDKKPKDFKNITRLDKSYLHVTKGMRVKAKDKVVGKAEIVKGLFGTVMGCGRDKVEVLFDNGMEFNYTYREDIEIPLEYGSVCTVHSIQGITIPEGSIALVDLLAPFTAKTEGGLYVCLSRTEVPENTIIVANQWSDLEDRWYCDVDAIDGGYY